MADSVEATWNWKASVLAVLVGALLTPVATSLSLQLMPLGAPMIIYGFAAAVFAYLRPSQNWEWGLWTSSGMLAALAVVIVLSPVAAVVSSGSVSLRALWDMTRITLLFGFIPALFGGCLGGVTGILLAHRQYRNAAVVGGGLIAIAFVVALIR